MKNRILEKALLVFVINLVTIQTQAQWTETGNNYTSGNLGVGIQSTYSQFHIEANGDDLLWPVTINNRFNASSITNYGVGIKLKHSSNSEHHKWGGIASIQESYWANTSGLALYANETEYVRIKSDGNVGIGTTSPTSTLDVSGDNGGVDNRNFRVRFFQTSNQHVGGAELAGIAHVGGNWTAMYAKQGNANSAAYFDGNIGVGTSSPLSSLHISTNEDAISWNLILNNSRNSSTISGYGAGIKFKNSGNHEDWKWSGIASVQEGYWSNYTGLALYADAKEYMRIKFNGSVGIGTTTPTEKLEVNGTIRSKEVKVEASPWPDYVFEPNYKLRSLEEIEKFIQSEKHLPDVPSAKEVEEDGIALGEMNALLLKKIEELTLYTIEQDIQIKNLNAAKGQEPITKSLEKRIEELTLHMNQMDKENSKLRQQLKANANSQNPARIQKPKANSQSQIEANGVRGDEMNQLLLKKIEELTLYTSQQQEVISKLANQNLSLGNQNSRLSDTQEEIIQRIEKLELKKDD